jgi:FkbM family methyltransferase
MQDMNNHINGLRASISDLASGIASSILHETRAKAVHSGHLVDGRPQLVMMDTCDAIIPENSYKLFSGDIAEQFLKLVAGMDDESRRLLTRVVKRLRSYAIEKAGYFQVTDEEYIGYRQLLDFHYDRILPLGDNWYLYDGRYFLPSPDISSTAFYYRHFVPELRSVTRLKDKDILDVGAYFGDSALVLSEFTQKKIWAIEPNKKSFELLQSTMLRNRLDNVCTLNLALGNAAGTLEVVERGDLSFVRALTPEASSDNSVTMRTIDSLVQEKEIDVGLIKLDVEGLEASVLEGARHTIMSQRPALLVSIYHNFEQFFGVKEWLTQLGIGYTFKVRKPLDLSVAIDTTLICEVD